MPFTLRDVLVDAIGALRTDWRAHVGWNVMWLCGALVSCCGCGILAAGIGAAIGGTGGGVQDPTAPNTILLVLLVYAVLLPLMFAIYAAHQSVTMTLTRARLRGTPMTMGEGIAAGIKRAPALAMHLIVRTIVEAVPIGGLYAVAFAVVAAAGVMDVEALRNAGPGLWAFVGVIYVLVIVLAFGARAFVGLGFPAVVAGSGPIAALGESVRLLRGRRWQFIRYRLVVLAAWVLGYATCMGPFFLASAASPGSPNPLVALVTLPLVLGFYGLMLVFFVLDAAIEASFHVRVTRPMDVAAIAETFA